MLRVARRLLLSPRHQMLTHRRILVIDDEKQLRRLLADALELEGFFVTTAADGREALASIDRLRPDAIILDLMMPVMNGWDFLAACRTKPSCRDVPIIVTSAHPRLDELRPSLGVSASFAKPYDLDMLIASILRLIGSTP